MKKIIIILMAMMATVTISAQSYTLHLDSINAAALNDGDTVVHMVTDIERQLGTAIINLYVENLTDYVQTTDQVVTVVDGPSDLEVAICAGGLCPIYPNMPPPYEIEANTIFSEPLQVKPHLTGVDANELLLRLEGFNSSRPSNKITVFLRVVINNNAIDAAEAETVKVYPNPTTGKVVVGDKEYDLSGRPAGVYCLPSKQGTARVIKL